MTTDWIRNVKRNPPPEGELVEVTSGEVAELRKEIADLKVLLTPSIILTGQRVIEEYWNLATPKR